MQFSALEICTALSCTALPSAVQCNLVQWSAVQYSRLPCTALTFTTLYYTTLHCTKLYCTALHCTALHWTERHHHSPIPDMTRILNEANGPFGTSIIGNPVAEFLFALDDHDCITVITILLVFAKSNTEGVFNYIIINYYYYITNRKLIWTWKELPNHKVFWH